MAEFTFYCEVYRDRYDLKKGVYTYTCARRKDFKYLELVQFSDKIWRQGPRGGVKIVKDREFGTYAYVTTDEKAMKKFMWVKLQARPYVKV